MKKFFLTNLILAISALLFVSAKRPKAGGPQTYAVIVGVSSFNDSHIIALRYAHRDAEAFRSFLESSRGGSIPDENIALLTNERATRASIVKNMRDFFDRATSDDVIIFYISTHGIPDPKIKTDLYYTTYDTDNTNYTGTALIRTDIIKYLSNSPAKVKLFYSDACHSGGSGIYLGAKDDGAELVNKMQISLAAIKEPCFASLAASSSSEQSYEDAKWGGGHGIFTYELIQGLEGAADKLPGQNPAAKGNGDGLVTTRELFNYLNNVIPAATNGNQHPEMLGDNVDAIPLSAVNTVRYVTAVKKLRKPETSSENSTSQGQFGNLTPKDEVKQYDTETKDMEQSICVDEQHAYGDYCFINDYGEDLLLKSVEGGKTFNLNYDLLVPAGEKTCALRLMTSYVANREIKNASSNITFTFVTVAEHKPIKRGNMRLVIETCKTKTVVLSKKSLYLSAD